jgi:hypothetical protein
VSLLPAPRATTPAPRVPTDAVAPLTAATPYELRFCCHVRLEKSPL